MNPNVTAFELILRMRNQQQQVPYQNVNNNIQQFTSGYSQQYNSGYSQPTAPHQYAFPNQNFIPSQPQPYQTSYCNYSGSTFPSAYQQHYNNQNQFSQIARVPNNFQSRATPQNSATNMNSVGYPRATNGFATNNNGISQQSRSNDYLMYTKNPNKRNLGNNRAIPFQRDQNKSIFYCEPCDKEFSRESAFTSHKATHEKCRHPGCLFEASKQAICAHYHITHGRLSGSGFQEIEVEGQRFRVLLGTSPSEIQEWRADRRKKFPTKERVAEKKKHLEEVIAAGGVPALSSVKKRKLNNNNTNNDHKRTKFQKEYSNKSDINNKPINELVTQRTNELSSTTIATEGVVSEKSTEKRKRDCLHYLKTGRCKYNEKCSYLHDSEKRAQRIAFLQANKGKNAIKKNNTQSNDEVTANKENRRSHGLTMPLPLAGGERGTLLKKLLQSEIAQEENIVLQCLRYIVMHHFSNNSM